MKLKKRLVVIAICISSMFSLASCNSTNDNISETTTESNVDLVSTQVSEEQQYIENTLNLANNTNQEWTYTQDEDGTAYWVLSIVSYVAYPELPDQQGVSVCVPDAYVNGIDTDGDNSTDITFVNYTEPVKGSLVIDYEKEIVSTNGQIYTASTAPVILNTGAAGYGSQSNSLASSEHVKDGYINISCGNRGKQDTNTDENGNTYYTGDAPSCLVDQKSATRFVKYNILLGNLPGNVNYFVSTGGSGGGAHAVMFAATSNNQDFYDYQIELGAVGVYKNDDGNYSTSVIIDNEVYEISDGAWGSIAYSPITSLYEADMALAFEYFMNTSYNFNTPFQEQLAEHLSYEYMQYINEQNLSVEESDIGFDLNDDGSLKDTIDLTIEYDLDTYPDTNGYYGTYLDLYLAEFTQNLNWYIDSLDYATDWTWFDENGNALSDEQVRNMTSDDKAECFLTGRYAKGSSGDEKGGMGMMGGGMPDGEMPDGMPDGGMPDGGMPDGMPDGEMVVGTPDSGTTQSATSTLDSQNYATYDEMVNSYSEDITQVYEGDKYGNNIVSLYNPLSYIGSDSTQDPVWTKMIMGASEGDMSMFSSLNLQIAWLNAGVDSVIEWQWGGGHVPNEVLGDSFSLYVDEMYGEYVNDSVLVSKSNPEPQTENGTQTEQTGEDISSLVNSDDISNVSFSLGDILTYRTKDASKAVPGFDVIDYGQEDYVFGSSEVDARHWNKYLLEIFEEYKDTLEPLFNKA